MVCRVRPTQVTLVPDSPEQLTSNAGWDTQRHEGFLTDIVSQLKCAGIRSSIFIDPDCVMADYARRAGADRVEFYTEPYAAGYNVNRLAAITPYVECARHCRTLGLGINAGHDLEFRKPLLFCTTTPCARRSEYRSCTDLRRAAHGTPTNHTTLPELPANGKVSSAQKGGDRLPPCGNHLRHIVILPYYSLCFTFL